MWIYLTTLCSYIKSRIVKFKKLVDSYRDNGNGLLSSVYYSARLVYKRYRLENYMNQSMVREKNILFVKTVIGGSIQLIPIKIKSGPKRVLEYAYFDGKRKDELFLLLSGPNRDFNHLEEILFMFGKEIRYKFMDRPETTIRSCNGLDSSEELEKKIFSLYQS